MRLSELGGKEIINIADGMRINFVNECDIVFDDRSGKIHSLLLPPKSSFGTFFNPNKAVVIPWKNIKKIGEEIIIVEMNKVD